MSPIQIDRHPDEYIHWRFEVEPPLARLVMAVQQNRPYAGNYELKLNSYDLGVDLELADAVQRLRFEHPEVKAVIVTGSMDRVFCAGANIHMLAGSTHGFKVNFCKFTNETRLAIEDATAHSGQHYLAACNGTTAGGGYELALACEEIYLVDDGNATVSLPEVPLLGVLPGTGGLTRLVDKRKVRRDLADVFCTTAEGVKGKRAVDWGLVDAIYPKSKFDEKVAERARAIAAAETRAKGPGITLAPLAPEIDGATVRYRNVLLEIDGAGRTASLTVHGPEEEGPADPQAIRAAGSDYWPLHTFRELDDALIRLRFDYPEIGLVLIRSRGDAERALAADRILDENRADWLVGEILLLMARTLRRLDQTARSFFALAGPGSCFHGSLLELALAADRFYMLADEEREVTAGVGPLNAGTFPMSQGLSRLEARLIGDPGKARRVLESPRPLDAEEACMAGIATLAIEDIDWEDDLRIAIEERVSLSPDALTGMEANLRFPGAETGHSKVFGRLSAWQNWIFQRPNAVGERGALTMYGRPERPQFDWRRT